MQKQRPWPILSFLVGVFVGAMLCALTGAFSPEPDGVALFGDWSVVTVSDSGRAMSTYLTKKDGPATVRLEGWVSWHMEPHP